MIGRELSRRLAARKVNRESLPPAALFHLDHAGRLDKTTPVEEVDFVVLDSETTGLDPARDRLVCVGAIKLKAGRIDLSERFFELVNPGCDMGRDSIRIHGIVPEMCADRPPFSDILPDLLDFIGPGVLVGHAIGFDAAFIGRQMREAYGFPLLSQMVDLAAICRRLRLAKSPYSDAARAGAECSLDRLAQLHRLDASLRHTALGDAVLTGQLFLIMLERLKRSGIKTLGRLLKIGRA